MIKEGTNRPDVIVIILQAANFSGGVTVAKITEKIDLIMPPHRLKEYLSVLEKNDLLSILERRASLSNDIQGNELLTNVQSHY